MTALGVLRTVLAARVPFILPLAIAVLPALFAFIVTTWVLLDKTQDAKLNVLPNNLQPAVDVFDFIVVGSGSAGMVVATRLANTKQAPRVLLLEAGGKPSPANNVPILAAFLTHEGANSWVYPSETQQNACLSCNNQFAQFHDVRPGKQRIRDYDQIAKIAGDNQWTYENMLPFFKKSENYQGVWPLNRTYHGTGGLLNVNSSDFQPGVNEFLAGAVEKGCTLGDYNGANQKVFSPLDITVQGGWRESVYRAFYEDTNKPTNLVIRKFALVTKVEFESKNGETRAIGVVYEKSSLVYKAKATKEVILSAGALNSPQILMLSGVGPAADLQSFGVSGLPNQIPVVKDLPVGQNMEDHCYTIVGPFPKSPAFNPETAITTAAALEFAKGRGPLAAPGFGGTGFIKSPNSPYAYPDLQIVQLAFTFIPGLASYLSALIALNETVVNQWWNGYMNKTDMHIPLLWLGKPRSVGSVKLRSTNPHDRVKWDGKYLTNPTDVETMLWGYKWILDLYENTAALNTTMIPNRVPGCEGEVYRSDDYFRCVIRHISGSFYHHVGTCAMGSVVDSSLKVIGIKGLRVIDASVIPKVPNGNTNAPAIAVGEKGADILIKAYNLTPL